MGSRGFSIHSMAISCPFSMAISTQNRRRNSHHFFPRPARVDARCVPCALALLVIQRHHPFVARHARVPGVFASRIQLFSFALAEGNETGSCVCRGFGEEQRGFGRGLGSRGLRRVEWRHGAASCFSFRTSGSSWSKAGSSYWTLTWALRIAVN